MAERKRPQPLTDDMHPPRLDGKLGMNDARASSTDAEVSEAQVFMFDADIGSMESLERLPHSRAIARRRCSQEDPP